jgi:poly(3-hydroxybutyrate) depolymerase
VGTGGSSASGGTTSKPGTGGAIAAGGSTAGGAVGSGGHSGTGGSSASGGTTSQPGTGGATAVGGNPGPDGGPTTGGAGGGTGSGIDGGSTTGAQSAGCGKTSTITSSQYNNGNPISITAANMQRRYILNVPKTYDNTKPYKLILAIHQLDGNDKQMYSQNYYELMPLSNDSAIFAAPDGQKGGAPCSGTGTNGDSGCGWPNSNGSDMALMDAVVAQIEQNFCVDKNRIFATGWSYGASMSYEIGCERPLGGTGSATWGVRAIAIYSGAQMSGSCKPTTPIGYYASHGTNDGILNYDGGVTLAQNFAGANGCTWATPTKATGAHVCTNEAGCKTGYPTEFCSFVGPHTPWPDNGSSMTASWQPPVVWAFFNQF